MDCDDDDDDDGHRHAALLEQGMARLALELDQLIVCAESEKDGGARRPPSLFYCTEGAARFGPMVMATSPKCSVLFQSTPSPSKRHHHHHYRGRLPGEGPPPPPPNLRTYSPLG